MREILFRAKQVKYGGWRYGDLETGERGFMISCKSDEVGSWDVIPKTIGQYTGVRDKNGQMIFEGDILKYGRIMALEELVIVEVVGVVVWDESKLAWWVEGEYSNFLSYIIPEGREVIGNIYDTKKHLKMKLLADGSFEDSCPCCGQIFTQEEEDCPKCGQKMDWMGE